MEGENILKLWNTCMISVKWIHCWNITETNLLNCQQVWPTNSFWFFQKICKISCIRKKLRWWWIVFAVWLTDERRSALFPSGTIVRLPRHLESPTLCEQDLTEPELRLCWMKLCSSDNHYSTTPYLLHNGYHYTADVSYGNTRQ